MRFTDPDGDTLSVHNGDRLMIFTSRTFNGDKQVVTTFPYADAIAIRDYISATVEEIKPEPSKEERLREILRRQGHGDPYFNTEFSERLRLALNVLDEDGPLEAP